VVGVRVEQPGGERDGVRLLPGTVHHRVPVTFGDQSLKIGAYRIAPCRPTSR
jgi:hypothetical protein